MINTKGVPECYRDYICFLKKYCLIHRISFEEANKHIVCIAAAEQYGITDVCEKELLKTLQSLKCDDVREVLEDAYDKTFFHCYGAYIGFCQPSIHNSLCVQRMQKDKFIERSI